MPNDIVVARYVPPMSIPDMGRLAEAITRSQLFGIKTVDQALALMAIAQAEGRHPALAARDYDIIHGRPSKKAEAMLRDFLMSGGRVEWHDLSDAAADATFEHPAGGTVRIKWDMDRVKKAEISNRDMYKKFPRQMLRSRCVSEGVRTVCPMATSGMYVPEEIAAIDEPTKRGKARNAVIEHAPAAPANEIIDADTGEVLDVAQIEREARSAAHQGRHALSAYLKPLPDDVIDRVIRPLLGTKDNPGELRKIARDADARPRGSFEQDFDLAPADRAGEPHPIPSAGTDNSHENGGKPLFAQQEPAGGDQRAAPTRAQEILRAPLPEEPDAMAWDRWRFQINNWIEAGKPKGEILRQNRDNIEIYAQVDDVRHDAMIRALGAPNG